MNTPELKVTPQLPVLAFNFEQLKSWATELTERYTGMVVTEDAIADVKRDMVELNKAKKSIDDARKEAVRRVSEPIRQFEDQIKEVCGIFDKTYTALAEQVKAFEQAEREEKRKLVVAIIEKEVKASVDTIGEAIHVEVAEKWLNKSTTLKSVREEVQKIVSVAVETKRLQREAEQARHDRAIAIESYVVNKNATTGLKLPVARFMLDMYLALNFELAETYRRIDDVFNAELAKQNAQREEPAPAIAAPPSATRLQGCAPVATRPQPQPLSNPTGEIITMSIVLEFDVVNGDQVQSCLNELKKMCVSYGVRQR